MENQQNFEQAKPKKPWYKKWWIWVIVGVLVIGAASQGAKNSSSDNSNNKETVSATEQQTEVITEAQTEKPTEQPTTVDTKKAKDDFINSCETIDYKTLSRNPDKFKGNNYKFTGQVIQVLDSDSWFDNSTTLRINVTATENQFAEGGYLWSDTILATVTIPDGDDRILEDDIIDIYGVCEGLYTYETVLGDNKSLPLIDIKYFDIHE